MSGRADLLLPVSALPSKPLNSIALADADSKAALSFVAEKLGDSHPEMTEKDKSLVSIFGGRMNDLEGLIFKVRTGQTIVGVHLTVDCSVVFAH